jgi:hypothetical protein
MLESKNSKSLQGKLQFIKNNNMRQYERKYKINNPIINKINTGELLTYKIIDDDKELIGTEGVELLSFTHMIQSNSQFVHLLYHIFGNTTKLKSSTGNKYNKMFIHQGSELKSSLDSKILKNIITFKKYFALNSPLATAG